MMSIDAYYDKLRNNKEAMADYINHANAVTAPGTVVRHFKRDMIDIPKKDPFMYLYEVVGEALHTETKERLIVYRALYGQRLLYCRPREMFISMIDKIKYPEAKQTYRLEVADFDHVTGRYY